MFDLLKFHTRSAGGQEHREGGPPSRLGINLDVPAMRPGNTRGGREPQPTVVEFGREKRFENSFPYGGVHSAAGVPDFNDDVFALRQVFR